MKNVTGGALSGDPFYRELRRRHGDIDIVVLAGQEPTPMPVVGPDVARRSAARTRETFDEIWSLVVAEPLPAAPDAIWRPGTVVGVVHTEITARHEIDAAAGRQLLTRSDDALTARGWATRLHTVGVPRLLASHDDMTIRLTWWEGALTLMVLGPGTSVGIEALRELMTEPAA